MCAMMPQRIAETDPFKAFTEVVGNGPFRFKSDERMQGSRFVYEKSHLQNSAVEVPEFTTEGAPKAGMGLI
jgi:hypothetical protein